MSEFAGIAWVNYILEAQDWAEPIMRITETHHEDIFVTVSAWGQEYSIFEADATFDDWDSENLTSGWVISAFDIEAQGPITWAIPDAIAEGTEGLGLKINAVVGGITIPDPDNDIYDIQIIDPPTGTENYEELNSSISVFPVIAENSITIKSSDPETFIEAVSIFTIRGIKIAEHSFDSNFASLREIDLRENTVSGYCILYIKTPKGMISKKFFKK